MGRILLAFGICQAAAVAAFLWVLPRELARRPEELSAWAAAAAGWFWVLAWPLLDERRAGEARRGMVEHGREVAGDGALLGLALAPWMMAGRVLAAASWGEILRAAGPAFAMLGAGAAIAWSARIGGAGVRRAGVAAALAGLTLGPVARFLSGAAGSFPGEPATLTARPWLAAAALAFPVAALAARRLRAGAAAPGEAS